MEKIAVKHLLARNFQTAESMKTLRTNLQFSGEAVKVVALTSFGASEGKSTISFQLAASLAELGKRVLLMDTDLRKSTLATRLKIRDNMPGMSHCLTGQAVLNETMLETDLPGLFVVLAGQRVPNSAELLGGKNFQKMLAALRNVFDYIIVDAAPLGQVIDCAVIAPEMDGVVMVVDATNNSYKQELRVKNQLEKSGGKILGVVLNRVDPGSRKTYYGKPYGCTYE